jgi:predicted transcriptional regulator
MVNQACFEINWVQHPRLFAKRMQKISKTQKFSVRETKLLSKLSKKAKESGVLDYTKLMYMFPGKTFASIKRMLVLKYKLTSWQRKCSIIEPDC